MQRSHRIGLLILLVSLLTPRDILAQRHNLSDDQVLVVFEDRPETHQIGIQKGDHLDQETWWQTWCFGGMALAVLVGLVVTSIRWRIGALEQRSRSLEAQVTERTKELNCLYAISQLVETPGISLEEILQGTVALIPPAWQYPEITCARIVMQGQEFSTQNFESSPWQQAATILVHGEQSGTVQVAYLQQRPQSDEGVFLREERNLLNAIAERLGNITKQMRAEERVREQHQFLQVVLDSLSHPFYVINVRDRSVAMANSTAYTGILCDNVTCHTLVHGSDHPCGSEHPCPLREVVKTKEPVIVEHVHLDQEGRRKNVEVHSFPIFDAQGNVGQIIEYSLDVTERKQIEAQKRLMAALEERERIGRELHDDLGQVMGYMNVQAQTGRELLEQGQTEQAHAILDQLAQVAQEAHADVRQYILGIRTRQPGIRTRQPGIRTRQPGIRTRMPGIRTRHTTSAQPPTNFFEALQQYLCQLHERYGLETHVSWPNELPGSPLASETETQVLRIIQEALTNVHKHAGVSKARLIFTLHSGEVQVIIEDDGRGFDTNHASSLTPHESRTTPHFGLDIMRERAEAIGGSLQIRSGPGEGTRVIARLPRVLETVSNEAIRGLRVLLVDDHPLYLDGLRNMLSARGVQVVGLAHDGLQAQELARKLLPDLILMDVHMPRCDGLEATWRIKADLPDVKIVMLTMAADDDVLFKALKNGASGYLLKSLAGKQFFDLLTEVMRGEMVLAPSLAARVLAEFARQGDSPVVEEEATLTTRQREVLELVIRGLTNKEIAARLDVSPTTVKYHVAQILERLQLKSRYELAQYVQEQGLGDK